MNRDLCKKQFFAELLVYLRMDNSFWPCCDSWHSLEMFIICDEE